MKSPNLVLSDKSVLHYTDFRDYLIDLLNEKKLRNKKYSLRALCRDLQMQPSHLSGVLNKEKGLSPQKILDICKKLDMKAEESRYFCDLALKASSTKKTSSARKPKIKVEYRPLQQDVLASISEWYHIAIFEMTAIKGFNPDHSDIAQKIGIKTEQVRDALERLKRLGMIRFLDGTYIRCDYNPISTTDIENADINKLLVQSIELSRKHVSDPISSRDYSSVFLSIDSSKLPEAKKKIDAFRMSLIEFLEDGKKDQLYCLSINLFSLFNQH